MGVTAVTLISLIQEYVAKYGDDTEVAVAIHLSVPMRQELMGVAADREVRKPDEQPPLDPPQLWLITGAPTLAWTPTRRGTPASRASTDRPRLGTGNRSSRTYHPCLPYPSSPEYG
jgi:hypothetical protein